MKNVTLTNGGAMPKINPGDVMRRAWEIFWSAYGDLKHPLKGRSRSSTFGYCLMLAWRSAKEAAAKADPIAARIAILRRSIEIESMSDCWSLARSNIASMRTEIDTLNPAGV